jgi:hypothetical protein
MSTLAPNQVVTITVADATLADTRMPEERMQNIITDPDVVREVLTQEDITDVTGNPVGKSRPLTVKLTSDSELDYYVLSTISYVHPANSKACKAERSHTFVLVEN